MKIKKRSLNHLNSNNIAPVGISTYIRLDHLKQTVAALQKNYLADKTEVFVFSDGPKNGDEEKVSDVRHYLKGITGFKRINIYERNENNRVINNRGGIIEVLNKYNRIIFLEEDVVAHPRFLEFINSALNFYQNNERIFAVCGYSPPIVIPANYAPDYYLSPRFSAWGFGIRKEMYDEIVVDITMDNYTSLVNDSKMLKKFLIGGADLQDMLKKQAEGKIDALDVKIFYTQFMHSMYTVHPTLSLTNNIGFDGTGIHCPKTNRFDVDLNLANYRTPTFFQETFPDRTIIKRLRNFREGGIKGKLSFFLKKIGMYSTINTIKNNCFGLR